MKGNLWGPLGFQNKDIGSSSQMLLTKVKLRLRRRVGNDSFFGENYETAALRITL